MSSRDHGRLVRLPSIQPWRRTGSRTSGGIDAVPVHVQVASGYCPRSPERCPRSIGIAVRNRSESLSAFRRNPHLYRRNKKNGHILGSRTSSPGGGRPTPHLETLPDVHCELQRVAGVGCSPPGGRDPRCCNGSKRIYSAASAGVPMVSGYDFPGCRPGVI
jgi:hypothetical protein